MNKSKTGLKILGKGFKTIIYPLSSRYERSTLKTGLGEITEGVKHIFGVTESQLVDKKIEELVVGVPEIDQVIYKPLLKNLTAVVQMPGQKPHADLLLLAKCALDNISMKSMVNVQPLTAPVGQVYGLKTTLSSNTEARIEITKSVVEARTRKFKSNYPLQDIQDLQTTHGPDAVNMASTQVGKSLGAEIDREILTQIVDLTNVTTVNISEMPLLNHINKAANQIALSTRRGKGNWAIVSKKALSEIYSIPGFVPLTGDRKGTFELKGALNKGPNSEGLLIYHSELEELTFDILIGYKGAGEIDSGITYCPYLIIMSSGIVVDPATFNPQISLMTRYGFSVESNASDYYQILNLASE